MYIKKVLQNTTAKSHEEKKRQKIYISISPTHNMTYLLGMSSSDSDSKTGALNIAPGLWVLDCILPR